MFLLDAFDALGTYWWVKVYCRVTDTERKKLQHQIKRMITSFERDYSRFRTDSFVSRLNRDRMLHHPPSDFKEMILQGIALEKATNGMFSLGVGAVLEDFGYDSTYRFTANAPNKKRNSRVEFILGKDVISLQGSGKMDLGGIGKGYLVGKLADFLKKQGVPYFMINGGGDIYASSDNGNPVTVYLQHPFRPDEIFADVQLKDASVCVSSPAKRQWRDSESGKVFTHIINPRDPDMEFSSLSGSVVIGKDPAIADALATVFCVMDENECRLVAEYFKASYRKVNASSLK